MNISAIINKVDAALRRVDATDRVVYIRHVTLTGGDPLIGRPGSVTKVDTLMDPQPLVSFPGANDPMVVSNGSLVRCTDYDLLCSPTALPTTVADDSNIEIVFKTGSTEEVCSIVAIKPVFIYGSVAMFTVYARSKKR